MTVGGVLWRSLVILLVRYSNDEGTVLMGRIFEDVIKHGIEGDTGRFKSEERTL